jgi:hypothetical protein
MRTKIEKKKDNCALYLARERKMIVGDNLAIIHRYAPHHVEENIVPRPKR